MELNCDTCSGKVEMAQGEFKCTKCGSVMGAGPLPDGDFA